MSRLSRVLVAIVALQAVALLGCQELNTCFGLVPQKNKPGASASPTASPTPGVFATAVKGLTTDIDKGVQGVTKNFSEAKAAAEKAIDDISGTDERAVGQAASFQVIAENGGLILEEGLVAYVNKVANVVAFHGKGSREPLVAKKSEKPRPRVKVRRFFVGILDTDEMTAYALPGGYLYVTRGLLQNLSSESDLAWVLGHEIAHVDKEHGLKALKFQIGAEKWAEQLVGVKTSFEDPNFFGKVAGRLAEFMIKHGYNKEDELEADSVGLTYATNAGYDAQGAARVLNLLATKPGMKKRRTHTSPEERLSALQAAIDASKKGKTGVARFENSPAIQRLTVGGTESL